MSIRGRITALDILCTASHVLSVEKLPMWRSNLQPIVPLKPRTYAFATLQEARPEEMLEGLKFRTYKYNLRPRPKNKDHVVVFPCFSEFGSELLGCLYCIPRLLQERYLGYYAIVLGWHGREYLYRHLVDEFWELDASHHWLREYCRAFHHASRNLRKLEKAASRTIGRVADANVFSHLTLSQIYPDLIAAKKTARWIPTPSVEAFGSVEKFLKPNSVGITARARSCYGRNLQIDFYKKLLDNLMEWGYDPVWIGEKHTTYECPYSHVTNFRDSPEADDLEKTLALISKLQFTVQFWTASTRLAGLMGVPYLIFESPDQIYGVGHEGMRLNLTTQGKRKLVISHFWNVYNNNEGGIRLVKKAIDEMKQNNWDDLIGLVESEKVVSGLRSDNTVRIFGK